MQINARIKINIEIFKCQCIYILIQTKTCNSNFRIFNSYDVRPIVILKRLSMLTRASLNCWLSLLLVTPDHFGPVRTSSNRFRTISDCFRTLLECFRNASDRFRFVLVRFGFVSNLFRAVLVRSFFFFKFQI